MEQRERATFKLSLETLTLTEIVSIVTVALILLGFFDMYTYYSFFGVEITHYLEPTEIIFSFAPLLSFLVIYILFVIIHRMIPELIYRPIRSRVRKLNWKYAIPIILLWGAVAFVSLYYPLTILFENIPYPNINLYDYLLIALLFFFSIWLRINQAYTYGIAYTIVVVCILLSNSWEYKQIAKKHIPRYNVSFQYGDRLLQTNSHFFYIGSTKNYAFFWDTCEEKVVSYPSQDIGLISTKRKRVNSFEL